MKTIKRSKDGGKWSGGKARVDGVWGGGEKDEKEERNAEAEIPRPRYRETNQRDRKIIPIARAF